MSDKIDDLNAAAWDEIFCQDEEIFCIHQDILDDCPICRGSGRVNELSPTPFATSVGVSDCSVCDGTGNAP